MKKCVDCKKEKSLDEFSNRKNPNKTKTIYFNSVCKSCVVKRTQKWNKENLVRIKK